MPTISNAQGTYTVQGFEYFNFVNGFTCQSFAYGTTYGPSQSPGYEVVAPKEDELLKEIKAAAAKLDTDSVAQAKNAAPGKPAK